MYIKMSLDHLRKVNAFIKFDLFTNYFTMFTLQHKKEGAKITPVLQHFNIKMFYHRTPRTFCLTLSTM